MTKPYLIRLLATLTAGIIISLPAEILAAEPLFSPYPGSKLNKTSFIAGENNQLLEAYSVKDKKFKLRRSIGDASHYNYQIDNVSSLAVFKNYQKAFSDMGLKTIFECSNESCGTTNSEKQNLGNAASFTNVYNSYRKPKYILAEKKGNSPLLVGLFIGHYDNKTSVYLSIVRPKPITLGLIKVNIKAAQQQPENPGQQKQKKDKKGTDHPLISRYPGTYIINYKQTDYEEISLPVGIPANKADSFRKIDIVGDINRITYSIDNVSTLKIFRNYVSGLTKAGFESVFSCEKNNCSSDEGLLQKLGDLIAEDHVYNYYRNARYLLMKNTLNEQSTYVAIYVGEYSGSVWIQQVVVRTEPLQQGLIQANADEILEQIKQKGKASIYGILFDYDKAEIKPESKKALKVIVDILNKNKKLSIYVVGHTDDTGNPKYNLELSQRRADAVVASLIKEHSINPSRIEAHGAGPYSPVATNQNDLGRKLNRRVELVEKTAKR